LEKGVSHLNKKTTAENPARNATTTPYSVLANTFPYLKDFTLFLLRKSPKLGPRSWINQLATNSTPQTPQHNNNNKTQKLRNANQPP